jgi:hypothetical protein
LGFTGWWREYATPACRSGFSRDLRGVRLFFYDAGLSKINTL